VGIPASGAKPRIKLMDGIWYCWMPRQKWGIVGQGFSAFSAFRDWQNGGINTASIGVYVL
jgi:hypothetical protein